MATKVDGGWGFNCGVKDLIPRQRVKGYFNHLNAELNPICQLHALLGAHHILHVSRIRVKGHFIPLNAELNPICHLLALLGTHHISTLAG